MSVHILGRVITCDAEHPQAVAGTLLQLYLDWNEEHLSLTHHNATHSFWQAMGLSHILVRKKTEKEGQGSGVVLESHSKHRNKENCLLVPRGSGGTIQRAEGEKTRPLMK